MDQLKSFLGKLNKQQFWVICGATACIALLTWLIATSGLSSKTSAGRQSITAGFSDGQSLTKAGVALPGGVYHPNPNTHEKTDQFINAYKGEIGRAWQVQYDKQASLFVWPKELSPQCIAAVKDLRPIETAVPYDPANPKELIKVDYRAEYRDYIKEILPKLAEKIGAKWNPTAVSGGTGGSGTMSYESSGYPSSSGTSTPGMLKPEDQKPVIVDWDPQNQGLLQKKLAEYPLRPNNVPTTLQMVYAQEDLWVLESLIDIIKNTNGEADAQWNAPIKKINQILIGSEVGRPTGQVTFISGPAGADGTTSMSSGGSYGSGSSDSMYGTSSESSSEMGYSSTSGTTTTGPPDPAEGRYVDKDYALLNAQQLRDSYLGTTAADAYLTVAKRMPVRLSLVMDQRRLVKLLAECGNATLPVEVRQVRINRESTGATAGGGGSSYSSTSYSSSSSSSSSYGSAGMTGATGENSSPYDIPVEIFGVVYIYNPPDAKTLAGEHLTPIEPPDASATPAVPATPDKVPPTPAPPIPAPENVPAAGPGPAAGPVPAGPGPVAPGPAVPGPAGPVPAGP